MPYSEKAHRFFAMCAHTPAKAKKDCPPKKTAKKLMQHGVKK